MPSGWLDDALSDLGEFIDCDSCKQKLNDRPEAGLVEARRGYQEEQLEEKLLSELTSMYEV